MNRAGNGSTRRSFLQDGTLVLAATTLASQQLQAAAPRDELKVALVTDLHYADKPPAGTRHYRETLGKLEEAAQQFQQDGASMLVELGDLIDAADTVATEQQYLATINRPFAAICEDHHYVLGNHCVDTLTKNEFLGTVGQEKSYYSFDRGGVHFVVLDACFRGDGEPYGRKNFQWTDANIPPSELQWLSHDLQQTDKPVVVFAHQRLDDHGKHSVRNHAEVRRVLEESGNVLVVFQGHSHQNDLSEIGGIHYCTLVAMVEGSGKQSSGYSLVSIEPATGTIKLTGFRKQNNHHWRKDKS